MKKLLDWIFDKDLCRTHPAIMSSITGEVLIRTTPRLGIYATETGRERVKVAQRMFLGNNAETVKKILRGELDYCLSHEDKDRYIDRIRKDVSRGGEYQDSRRDASGDLSFVICHWRSEDLIEIKYLLSKI